MKMVTRKMTAQDVPSAARLLMQLMESDASYISHGELQMGIASAPGVLSPDALRITESELAQQLADGAEAMFVAEGEGTLIGFVSARIERQFGTSYGMLADIGVSPDARGFGVGRALVERVLETFQKAGVPRVFLESGLDNHGAHEFFGKFGFSPVSKVFALEL